MSCLGVQWAYDDQFEAAHFKEHHEPNEANLDKNSQWSQRPKRYELHFENYSKWLV